MNGIRPIDCGLHDHLEIACLFGYELEVLQKNDTKVVGIAVTTRTAGGEEFLVLNTTTDTINVPMHEIKTVSVRTLNAKFQELSF